MSRRVIPCAVPGAVIACVVVGTVVTIIFVSTFLKKHAAPQGPAVELQFSLVAKSAVMTHQGNASSGSESMQQLDELAVTPVLKLRAAVMAAELVGRDDALARLRGLAGMTPTTQSASRPALATAVEKVQEASAPPVGTDGPDAAEPQAAPADDDQVRHDAADLIPLYENPSDPVEPATRTLLRERHPWYADAALSYEKPADPLRASFNDVAGALVVFGLVVGVLGGGGLLVGVGLFIFAIVMVCLGKMTPAFDAALRQLGRQPVSVATAPDAAGGLAMGENEFARAEVAGGSADVYPVPYATPVSADGPTAVAAGGLVPGAGTYIEAFALYLVLFFGTSVVLSLAGVTKEAIVYVALFVVIGLVAGWPLLRGVDRPAWRLTTGLHTGRGLFFETGAGLVGYFGGLPVIVVGFLTTIMLVKLTGADAGHPIQGEPMKGLGNALKLYFLASVFAPITEELMFRGVLVGHLRGKLGVFLSAGISGVIFAAIHPQGWAALPGLASIGVVLALIRQWRGSLVPSIVAHAFHNGVLVTIMLYVTAWS